MLLSQLSQSLTAIRLQMLEHGDAERADKIAELSDKISKGKAAIAFSGHFSAGKSSLINTLCGRKLLPTGPIPTSANLVVIEDGDEGAVVFRGDMGETPDSGTLVPIEQLDEYCKDGETYRRIDIRYSSGLLANRLCLLDTPGVDSTDETHKLATESSLHLADAVMYVTDYNHVLSEMNLSFTKRLKDRGKPLYIIVNQIDKHLESELSFEAYKSNVKAAFHSWGVRADGFLFVSVKDTGHPGSDWDKLLWLIDRLKDRSEALFVHNTIQSAHVLIRDHIDALYPESDVQSSIGADADDCESDAINQLHRLDEDIRESEQYVQRIFEQFRRELVQLIENAQIIPASTRDLADRYLQGRRPGFKAGLWFAGKKTKAEIDDRLNALHSRISESVENQLVWHLNQLIRQYVERYGEQGCSSEPIKTELSAEWLANEVNESAGYTNEYTMTYCNLVAEQIKSDCRRKATDKLHAALSPIVRSSKLEVNELAAARAEVSTKLDRLRKQANMRQEREQYKLDLTVQLDGYVDSAESEWPDPEMEKIAGSDPFLKFSTRDNTVAFTFRADEMPADASAATVHSGGEEPRPDHDPTEAFHYRSVLDETAFMLENAAELLTPVSSLAQVRSALHQRAQKLRDNRFTVALFGAFSAGKSSLANALFGESVLPVSPNPTTAAINSIVPPTAACPHQTAHIRMKSAEALLSDVRYSLSMLGLEGDGVKSVSEAMTLTHRLTPDHIPVKGKPHLSFLHAVESGFEEARNKLGTSWTADFDTYRRYVAEENKSCFVDSIDLHYETGFGSQGVVFVDTPGADSIHARHTGVTFNYIKNADAILFVTYYNHAFSQADKQFLLQLGRVKDAFDLDKMFFLVNAADLAESEGELRQVLDYVEHQLLLHGIRRPRLFAVSSRMALEARQAGDTAGQVRSGMALFEREFSRFAERELSAATVRAAYGEMERAAGRLRQYVNGLQEGDEQRKKRFDEQRAAVRRLTNELRRSVSEVHTEPVHQELSELLHHVKQRCSYRFGELYNDAFHPSALQNDGRNIDLALQSARKQLLQSSSIDASQELLATTLRMEQYVRGKVQQWVGNARTRIESDLPEWIADDWLEPAYDTPVIGESIGPVATDEKLVRRLFKSAKQFFEGEGKQTLRKQLEPDIAAALSVFVDNHAIEISGHYERWMIESIRSAAEFFVSQLEIYANINFEEKGMEQDIEELHNRLASIESYIRRFE